MLLCAATGRAVGLYLDTAELSPPLCFRPLPLISIPLVYFTMARPGTVATSDQLISHPGCSSQYVQLWGRTFPWLWPLLRARNPLLSLLSSPSPREGFLGMEEHSKDHWNCGGFRDQVSVVGECSGSDVDCCCWWQMILVLGQQSAVRCCFSVCVFTEQRWGACAVAPRPGHSH